MIMKFVEMISRWLKVICHLKGAYTKVIIHIVHIYRFIIILIIIIYRYKFVHIDASLSFLSIHSTNKSTHIYN